MLPLILASGSPYRRTLLENMGLSFSVCVSKVNEQTEPGESPASLVQRLARLKAQSLSHTQAQALWIGADQIVYLPAHEEILGKPLCFEKAWAQLSRCSGREIEIHTALCVYHPQSGACFESQGVDRARFRVLQDAQIRAYLHQDSPYDCCGSVKIEQAGLRLFHEVSTSDPSRLMGLSLIALTEALLPYGFFQ